MTKAAASETNSTSSSSSSSNGSIDPVVGCIDIRLPQSVTSAVLLLQGQKNSPPNKGPSAASLSFSHMQVVTKTADSESESTTTTTTISSSSSNGSSSNSGAAGTVLGCIDIRLPQSVTGAAAIGVPDGDAAGCYLLNVVVEEESRGQGLGKALMKAAVQRAVQQWGAERLYTHVEATNEVGGGVIRDIGVLGFFIGDERV